MKKVTDDDIRQYKYLVDKIAWQEYKNSQVLLEDLKGYGYEGLMDAFQTYNPDKGQTFKQYAAYRIYYFIRNNIYKEGTTVRMNSYVVKERKSQNQSLYIMSPIEYEKDGEILYRNEPSENPVSTDNIWELVRTEIRTKYKERDFKIFAKSFGLYGESLVKKCEVAKEYHITPAAVTLNNQKIIKFLKSKPEILDSLRDLL